MAETTHTPGPWAISDYAQDIAIRGACTELVAIVPDRANWRAGVVDDGEREANARLIAAAPELLEVARVFLAQYPGGINPWLDNARSLARAAIDKAEGRAPLSAAQAGRAV